MVVAIAIIWFRLLASVRFVTSLPVQSWLFIVFFFFFNFIRDSCGQEAKPTTVTSPVEGKKIKLDITASHLTDNFGIHS